MNITCYSVLTNISMVQNNQWSDLTFWCLFQEEAVHISALFHPPQPIHLSLPWLPCICHLSSACPSKWSKWNFNKESECEKSKSVLYSERHQNGVYVKTRRVV